MFKLTKLDIWWENLPASTKTYLKNQTVWHDRDMWHAGILGCVVGILIGLCV